ncbi:MAG TPA: hypothetical protein VFZ49_08920, partial [Pyrinomonadaceae bacterium]
MRSTLSFIFIVALCLNPLAISAQTTASKKFDLSIDNIMRGPGLVGYEPTGVRWSPDSQRIYFRWKRADEPLKADVSTYVVNADGTGLRKLSDEELKRLPPATGDLSDDKQTTVFADGGDIFIYNFKTGERQQLTKTTDVEGSPRFTADQRGITFTRQNNLYSFSLDGKLLEQLTDIRTAGAAAPTSGAGGGAGFGGGAGRSQQGQESARTGTESQESVKKEERSILDVIRERAEKREEDEKKRKETEKDRRKPLQLTAGQTAGNMSLSPDGKFVTVMVNESATGAKNTIVPNYVTESGYTEDIPSRTKVGDIQGRSRISILDVATGEAKWVDHGQRL